MRKSGVSDNQKVLDRMRRIDTLSPVPYYYQLQEALKQEIDAGSWRPGDRLPSESELSTEFGISRTVIRQALDVLEADAQVRRIKGKGAFVSEPKLLYQIPPTGDEISTGGGDVSAKVIRVIDASRTTVNDSLLQILELTTRSEVFELTVLQAVHDTPASLSHLYLRVDASPALLTLAETDQLPEVRADEDDALVQLSRRYHIDAAYSEVTVEATSANKFEADTLLIEVGRPMFLLSSRVKRTDGLTLGFMRSVVRTDYFRFSIRIDH